MKSLKNNNVLIGIVIIISYFLMMQLQGFIFLLLQDQWLVNNPTGDFQQYQISHLFTVSLAVESIFIAIIAFFCRHSIKDAFHRISNNKKQFFKKILIYYLILFLVNTLFSFIDSVLFTEYIAEAGANQDLVVSAVSSGSMIFSFISIVITAPLIEEFVFRFAVMNKVFGKAPKIVAIIASSLIFTFIHIGFGQFSEGIPFVIHVMMGYLPIALCLSIIYAKEQKLEYSISVHLLNNLIGFIAILHQIL